MKRFTLAAALAAFTLAQAGGARAEGAEISADAAVGSETADARDAEAPPPFRNFEARRIGAPAPGSRRLITVQVRPEPLGEILPDSVPLPPAPGEGPDARPPVLDGAFAEFWDRVRPERSIPGPTRLAAALGRIEAGLDAAPPRLETLTGIARRHGRHILRATAGTDVSPALVLAVIAVESAGQADAVSHAGAEGLMQLMPGTAARFGVADSHDAPENIRGGVEYLDWLIARFNRDPILALAGYNAGEGAVDRHAGVPPYAETRAYVPKVLAAWNIARGLCRSRPELIFDPCVFVVDMG